ncbi:unnamed protein product [Pleuronectes platessa]|uniref:Uncharacterized protein n=1 Tax=Pleuronectes platessa TaxID=8262 RepID=A0A9N7YT68_PLEPL|nr:unnamed protein product [Pleuronectes platessa]
MRCLWNFTALISLSSLQRRWQVEKTANPSPSKLPTIDDEQMEGVRRALQTATYTCKDKAVTRQELYDMHTQCSIQAMGCLIKNVWLRRAAQQQAAAFKAQLGVMKGRYKDALHQVKVLQACAAYSNDDVIEKEKESI